MTARRNIRSHAASASKPGVSTYGTRCGFGANGRLNRSRHVGLRMVPRALNGAAILKFFVVSKMFRAVPTAFFFFG